MHPLADPTTHKPPVAVLQDQLRTAGRGAFDNAPEWATGLPGHKVTLTVALVSCCPRLLDRFQIDEALPHHNQAADHGDKLAAVLVCRLRNKLGENCIETIWDPGYRAHPEFMSKIARP